MDTSDGANVAPQVPRLDEATPETAESQPTEIIEATGEEVETRASERIGQAQGPLTPLGALACALIGSLPGAIFGWPGRGCEHATSPADRRACENVTNGFSYSTIIICGIAAFF